MNRANKISVTIVHALPGRLRMSVSVAPRDAERLTESVMGHAGLQFVEYTPATQSVLVRFNPEEVAQEEVVFRVGLALSLDRDGTPVRVLAGPGAQVLSNAAAYSGMLVAAALAGRALGWRRNTLSWLDWAAGAGTAGAVFGHGWREIRLRGYFDPEVLSLAYLVSAMWRGDFIRAALVTWFTAFGRHLLEAHRAGVEIRPMKTAGKSDGEPRYEVVVAPDLDASDGARFVDVLRALVKYAMTGGREAGLLADLREVSKVHGEVMHGLGWMGQGIPMRFE